MDRSLRSLARSFEPESLEAPQRQADPEMEESLGFSMQQLLAPSSASGTRQSFFFGTAREQGVMATMCNVSTVADDLAHRVEPIEKPLILV